jgi:adenylate cyclase
MPKLKLRLLGEPEISFECGGEVRLSTEKSKALLIYLASPAGVARSRDQVASLLWSRNDQEQARTNLRQNLARLRKSLGAAKDLIVANAQQLELLEDQVETDVSQFEDLLSQSDHNSLVAAAELLKGEFAAGLSINEGPFEDWIASERRRISESAISALRKLLEYYEAEEDHDQAAYIACKLLTIDPLQERVHQSFMRALAKQDRFESALQQYKICRDILQKELGVDPTDQIRQLRDDISRQRLARRPVPNAPDVETDGLMAFMERDRPKKPENRELPPQLEGLDLTVPERPSLLILPFKNSTGNEEQDHLAEGIRIDIQAALVKITGIFMIAAGSANAMRGKDARTAGNAMGVRYVLQGSVRGTQSNLRIAAELIDVVTGTAIWTDNYDRKFDDGFEVQDEIIEEIITALDVKLLRGEQAAVWHKTLKDRNSLEYFYKGVNEFFKLQKDAILRARRLFEVVDKKQPNVGIGATWVAMCHWFDAFKAWRNDPAESLNQAGVWAQKAVNMEDADGQAHMVLSHVHLMKRQFDDALIVGREAVKLRPNCTNANGFFGNVLHYCGHQRDAIEHVTWAIRYSPVYPPFFADVLSLAFLFDGSFDAAATVANESVRLNPASMTAQLVLIASNHELGDVKRANEVRKTFLASNAGFSMKQFAEQQPYRNSADLKHFVSRLETAGLPS